MNGIKAFLLCSISMLAITVSNNSSADNATTGTGNELIKYCNQNNYLSNVDKEAMLWVYCMAYVDGVVGGFSYTKGLIKPEPTYAAPAKEVLGKLYLTLESFYCKPENTTREQSALVVSKYLSDNPGQLNESAKSLVITAFMKTWPCPTDNKK
ncbi:MAG TPA: Rap1a/Tai family immunity protein [Gammaproteobacteria bacterium]|jgi:hypothetical protein|nr:Rap1a/Tai family immunity protein [Gammaproteobacteria bacterium]